MKNCVFSAHTQPHIDYEGSLKSNMILMYVFELKLTFFTSNGKVNLKHIQIFKRKKSIHIINNIASSEIYSWDVNAHVFIDVYFCVFLSLCMCVLSRLHSVRTSKLSIHSQSSWLIVSMLSFDRRIDGECGYNSFSLSVPVELFIFFFDGIYFQNNILSIHHITIH